MICEQARSGGTRGTWTTEYNLIGCDSIRDYQIPEIACRLLRLEAEVLNEVSNEAISLERKDNLNSGTTDLNFTSTSVQSTRANTHANHNLRFLIVDDEGFNLIAMDGILSLKGYK